MITIYHNPRCGKSRDCLLHLELSNKEFKVIKYLETVTTFEELSEIIQKLRIKPIELVRQKEKIWVEQFKNKPMNDQEIIQAMIDFPILIERPIVVNGDKAIIARPLEKANAII